MCGIFGYINRKGRSLPNETLRSMADSIKHRGPDDFGMYNSSGVALCNQRLSVIDIAEGHQPFISDDGQIVIVQNGEIYNHIELAEELRNTQFACRTHSDTEVLLRLYERDGIEFIKKLNGMFAIAIYDARQQTFFLARDRIGVKPLYYYDDGEQLIFGSEIKAILRSNIPAPIMDSVALHHYLSFNYVPAPYTMYLDIKHLMPGHIMKVTPTETHISQWWDLAAIEAEQGRSEESWIEEFNAILDDAVRIRLRCDVPFGAFLSGGVDSSSIVGHMSRHMDEPVKTFCIGFHDSRYDESKYAKEAADRFGTEHTTKKVDPDMLSLWPMATYHCDQPHGDVSFLPTYKVSQLAAKHVKVVLTGDGGDELFAGYDKYKNFFADPEVSTWSDEKFQRNYFDSISLFDGSGKKELYLSEMSQSLTNVDSFEVARPYFDKVKHQDRINQALFLDMQLLLSGNNLVKPDRMGMAVSLEARTPFLDYRMMEFAFRVPGQLKLKSGVTKYIYKKAVSPLIGDNLSYRKKQMFTVPVGEWFKSSKAEYCRGHMPRNLFNSKSLDYLCDQHICGKSNFTRELRALIAVSHWQDNLSR